MPSKNYRPLNSRFYFQDIADCGSKRELYCDLYITGHCSIALYRVAVFKKRGNTSLVSKTNSDFATVCNGLKLTASADDGIKRKNVSNIDPIYLWPKIHESVGDGSFEENVIDSRFYKRLAKNSK